MFLYYKNSFLASVVSILGCLAIVMSLMDAFSDKAFFIGFGIVLLIAGNLISNRKAFKTWWKQVEALGLDEKMKSDVSVAKAVYDKNPKRVTLKKIETLNPEAAAFIREQTGKK